MKFIEQYEEASTVAAKSRRSVGLGKRISGSGRTGFAKGSAIVVENIGNTLGHPAEVLVEVAQFLIRFVATRTSTRTASSSLSRGSAGFSFTKSSEGSTEQVAAMHELLTNTFASIRLCNVWFEGDVLTDGIQNVILDEKSLAAVGSSNDNDVARPETSEIEIIRSNRSWMLMIFRTFGIMCNWPHNVACLKARLGENILALFHEITNCFVDRLISYSNDISDALGDRLSASSPSVSIGKSIAGRELEATYENLLFAVNGLVIGAQSLICRTSLVSQCLALSQMGILPLQPWKDSTLKSLFRFRLTEKVLQHTQGIACCEEDEKASDVDSDKMPVLSVPADVMGKVGDAPQNLKIDPYRQSHVTFLGDSLKYGKSALNQRQIMGSAELAISIIEGCSNASKKLYSIISERNVNCEGSPSFKDSMISKWHNIFVNILTIQAESVFGFLCVLSACSELPVDGGKYQVASLWADKGLDVINGFVWPERVLLPHDSNGTVSKLVLQRGLLVIKINHIFALLIPPKHDIAANSVPSFNALHSAEQVGQVTSSSNLMASPADVAMFKYDAIMFDALLALSKWIHKHGFQDSALGVNTLRKDTDDLDPISEKNLEWLNSISIKASGPSTFSGACPGCDTWPWSEPISGDESFTDCQNNYHLCSSSLNPDSDAPPNTAEKVNQVRAGGATDTNSDPNVRSSFLNVNNTPLFKMANNPNRLECRCHAAAPESDCYVDDFAPPWLNKLEIGHAWEVLFAVLVGVCFNGNYNSHGKVDEKFFSDRMGTEHLHTVFTSLIHSVTSCLNDPACINVSQHPILQLHFILFLARCFKQTPIEVVALCRQNSIMELLVGDHFLLGGAQEIGYIFSSTYCSLSTSSEGKGNKYSMTIDTSVSLHSKKLHLLSKSVAWVYFHDAVLDLIRCLLGAVSVTTGEQLDACSINITSMGMRKDILLLMQTLSNSIIANYDMDNIAYQLVCLLTFAFAEASLGMDADQIYSKCIAGCIQLSSKQLEAIGIKSTYPHDPFHHEYVSRMETKKLFLWVSRAATLRLLLRLLAASRNVHLDVFLDDPAARQQTIYMDVKNSQGQNTGDDSLPGTPSDNSTKFGRESEGNKRLGTTNDSAWSAPPDGSNVSATRVLSSPSSRKSEKESGPPKYRGYYHMIASLMYDPRCKDVAINDTYLQ